MVEKNKIPFPQADDFEKIVKIINMENPKDIKNNKVVSECLGDISERQVHYYLSACMYLNILDENKELTEEGVFIRNQDYTNQTIELIRLLLADKQIGRIYITEKFLGFTMTRDEIKEYLIMHANLQNETVANRRAQTVLKWIEWINKNLNEKDN